MVCQSNDENGSSNSITSGGLISARANAARCCSCLLYTSSIQKPVAYLTCNFNALIGDKPALFTHDEVTTLFHEFGHGIHHMLTKVDVPDVAGINGVPWDCLLYTSNQ